VGIFARSNLKSLKSLDIPNIENISYTFGKQPETFARLVFNFTATGFIV